MGLTNIKQCFVYNKRFFLPEEIIPEAFAITRTELTAKINNLGEKPILVSNPEGKIFMVGKSAGANTNRIAAMG